MKTNRESDRIIMNAVQSGIFKVNPDGTIWRGSRRAEKVTGNGYLQVRLMKDSVRYVAGAHRVVYMALVGPIPDGYVINHKNGQKGDNRPENLEAVTYSENSRHSVHVIKTHAVCRQHGERNPSRKLSQAQVDQIKARRMSGERLRAIAADFGVTDRTVSKIALGQRWALTG